MVKITLRSNEQCKTQPHLLWDHVWVQEPITSITAEGGFGDWDVGKYDEPGNMGGLRAKASLHTATLILLFTDRRAPEDRLGLDLPEDDSDDPRGWWGDSIQFEGDQYERELGSHLWMLERGTLSQETALIAKEMAEQALAVLTEQGIVALTEVETEAIPEDGILAIGVRHFSQDGTREYDQKFSILWNQTVRYAQAQTLTR